MNQPLEVTRHVAADDPDNYSNLEWNVGDVMYAYEGTTYGCIREPNWAATVTPGVLPFFEFPYNALQETT